VAKVTEIPAGTIKVVTGKGQEILLAKVEGTLRAMNRRCEQRGGSHGGNNQCPA
jgi:nitrite reductase/ring-hydroxylating ferredoxin subunit